MQFSGLAGWSRDKVGVGWVGMEGENLETADNHTEENCGRGKEI